MKSKRGVLNVLTAVFLLLAIIIFATPAHAEFQLVERSTNTIGSTTVTWDSSFHDLTYSSPRLITVTVNWNVDNGTATYADLLLNSFSPKSKKDPANGIMATPAVNSNNPDGSGEVTFQFRFTELHYDIERDTYIGNAHFQLMLNVDKNGDGSPDRVVGFGVNVHVEGVESVNTAPVANAGPDQTVFVGDTVTCNGSGSHDADGDPLTFLWSFEDVPAGSAPVLSSTTAMNPTFVANVAGTYTLKLIVNDGLENSTPDTMDITVEEEQPPPQGVLLEGDPSSLAVSATYDLNIDASNPDEQIENNPYLGRVVRTLLEIGFVETATVGQVNSLLESINGRIITMLQGVAMIIIRIPDPGNIPALESIILNIESNSIVLFADMQVLPELASLPDNFNHQTSDMTKIDHNLAVRGHAAWNAQDALQNIGLYDPPLIIVADKFGRGRPVNDYGFNFLNFDDFEPAALDPRDHGYAVASVIGAEFGGSQTDRGLATGLYPAAFPNTLPLRVIDMANNPTMDQVDDALIKLIRQYSGMNVVVNTSFGSPCSTPDQAQRNCSYENAQKWALKWIKKVRDSGLENTFFHLSAAGNTHPNVTWDTDARVASRYNAAKLLSGLEDCLFGPVCTTVPNLTNILVVENQINSVTTPYLPICLYGGEWASKFPGNISAIGSDVWALSDPAANANTYWGTSLSAPQVAALAAYVWALNPSLSVNNVISIISNTSKDATSWNPSSDPNCTEQQPAPIIDAYEAVLALDAAGSPTAANSPVRFSILDFNADNRFDENDLQMFISRCYDTSGAEPVLIEPLVPDYSRLDLNGDGWTGGSTTTPFDLDRTGSGENGMPNFSTATQNIEGTAVNFNETTVSDSNILCYYAYSNLYSGDDQTVRKEVLNKICHEECTYDSGTDWCSKSCPNPVTGLTTTTYVGFDTAAVTISGEGTYMVYHWARAPEAPDALCPPRVGAGSWFLSSTRNYVSGFFRYFTFNSALIPSHYYDEEFPYGKNCWPGWPMGYCAYDCPPMSSGSFPGECSDWWGHYDEEGNWVEFGDP